MSWVALVILVVAVVLVIVLAPKAPKASPPEFDEPEVPTAEEGSPIPVVYGTHIVKSSNVVWYGDLAYAPVKTKGGK